MKLRHFVWMALAAALVMAGLASPFASSRPDGLERVAADKGFLEQGEGKAAWTWAFLPDYAVPGVGNSAVATGLAGIAGVGAVFACGWLLGRAFSARTAKPVGQTDEASEH